MTDYKKAIEVLFAMLKKYKFTKEEKDAIMTAIGTLDFGSLARNRATRIIRNKHNKKINN
ncbi:MAG: hypothetical protein A2312_04145 [Candidatus Staskawiczbacteria bacterium RIFOXYB2_FULL_32_9]|uniref:Uncharacterized protein n=1 Tax=Candidatus Staskawiczbacteria bacterium RIFOXYD1_FULL_32_13 TaxID=1802234 RepID=A0A1G2JS05_9BACT|nr:MAG: hypothetical protein UR22_C0020G0012 [Parcubacteria group bacterium GW2011_GWC2_32_10]OGZ80943.1 MAG: hypothetical protein A2360_01500 [Candidatus Staskawiczbacteria bacterium RIFOXYB1_FULL_32_11]OGZ84220.1 MAG: hypothetical protein A2312_04145 [Candidatus Staskawiczbacteria bacterium RIFOXYB2_FULL_32_9]OGZ87911.1 MAG: hypothetical protein A2463_00915 [Candidatus Staskawiczbacteria bacterium RIFOXYC2_FULL_32_10]OGZ89713.1 MAG: hypothetical protein A2561_00295 [Candidatus Staskawiczbacte